jgi:hypothetical protein
VLGRESCLKIAVSLTNDSGEVPDMKIGHLEGAGTAETPESFPRRR